jgi:hypothetical protein
MTSPCRQPARCPTDGAARVIRFSRGARLLVVLLALSSLVASAARASQRVTLAVTLAPERLGAGTTIEYGFRVLAPGGRVPSPLSTVELLYPAHIGLITSGLGLATCSSATLELLGPQACPADALMGRGSALVEIPVGPAIIREAGAITTWMAPPRNGRVSLLFYAEGRSPVLAELIFPGLILDAPTPYGGRLTTQIPEIPTLPEGHDAAVVEMHATIGPKTLTYYERRRHHRVAYTPNGIVLPGSCPRGGFPFAADFTFLDGSHASARTAVPCPDQRAHRHG